MALRFHEEPFGLPRAPDFGDAVPVLDSGALRPEVAPCALNSGILDEREAFPLLVGATAFVIASWEVQPIGDFTACRRCDPSVQLGAMPREVPQEAPLAAV